MGNSTNKPAKGSSNSKEKPKGGNVKQLRSQYATMEKDHKKNQKTLVKKSKPEPKKAKSKMAKPKPKSKMAKPKPKPKPKAASPKPAPKSQAPAPSYAGSSSNTNNNNNNNNSTKKWGSSNSSNNNNSTPVNKSSANTSNSKYVSDNAHGFTKEQQLKQVFKYDFAKEKVVCEWVSSVSGVRLNTGGPDKIQSQLEDGVTLCKLINSILKEKVVPDSMMKSRNPYSKNERIGKFSEQCKSILHNAPFEVNDLHNPGGNINITAVIDGLYSLGLACNKSNKINVAKMNMPKANTGNRMDV